MVRVIVAEDHPVFREGLELILADRDFEVLAAVADGDAAVEAVAARPPDVVLMDLAMPGGGGLEATRRITAAHPGVAVLVLTMSEDDASILAALRAGARGYLLKEAQPDEIADAVTAVARGASVLGPKVSARVLGLLATGAAPRPFPQLTAREHDVLDLLARGLANAGIARDLGLSEKTVRNVVSQVLAKLGAATRAEAVAVARDAGLGS